MCVWLEASEARALLWEREKGERVSLLCVCVCVLTAECLDGHGRMTSRSIQPHTHTPNQPKLTKQSHIHTHTQTFFFFILRGSSWREYYYFFFKKYFTFETWICFINDFVVHRYRTPLFVVVDVVGVEVWVFIDQLWGHIPHLLPLFAMMPDETPDIRLPPTLFCLCPSLSRFSLFFSSLLKTCREEDTKRIDWSHVRAREFQFSNQNVMLQERKKII